MERVLKHICFVTGASGVGKTTLFRELEKRHESKKEWRFLHFDSIGVPSHEDMIKRFGSGEISRTSY
jgi:ABC-type ATPase involved in cell division